MRMEYLRVGSRRPRKNVSSVRNFDKLLYFICSVSKK